MTHSDDDGLVLPPAIAPYQVVIIPILALQNEYAHKIAKILPGVRVLVDDTDARSSDKMWKWIKRGVPLRIEVGANEMESNTVTITRRDFGKSSKTTINLNELTDGVGGLLQQIQSDMLAASVQRNKEMIHNVADLTELSAALAADKIGFFRIKYAQTTTPEFEELMDKYKISRRCLDDADPEYVFVAKSY